MKKIIFILTLAIFLRPVFPVIEYAVNYEYISKVLCVNKAKPQMHCNGKCHLMKELAKAAENEKPISSDKKQTPTEHTDLFFYTPEKPTQYTVLPLQSAAVNSRYSNLYTHLNSGSYFHPPTFIS